MMLPGPDNPEGFWERLDIFDLHTRFLKRLHRTWDMISPLPRGWYDLDEAIAMETELIDLVRKDFSGHALWMWKDPLTCHFLSLWKKALKNLGIDLQCIFTVRSPLDVARSLKKRNGFSYDKSFRLWFSYNLEILSGISDVQTVFISYDSLLDDAERQMRACAEALRIDWPKGDSEVMEELRSSVRPELRHSTSGMAELEDAKIPSPVTGLYKLLLSVTESKGKMDITFGETIRELADVFFADRGYVQHDIGTLWNNIDSLSNQVIDSERRCSELQLDYDRRTEWALRLDKELKDCREYVGSLQKEFEERTEWALRLDKELKERDERIRLLQKKVQR